MELALFSGSANRPLADAVARELGSRVGECLLGRFPDGEIHVDVREEVRGRDVFLVQPTSPPAGENLLELLLLADACRRAGAAQVSAVIPYFGYARHDRRVHEGEPLGARVVADLLGQGRFARVVAVDLHTGAVEGCFQSSLEHLSAIPLLAAAVRTHVGRDSVVVSPDLGAVKLAEEYARRLELPMAIVHKARLSGTEVSVRGVVGEVRGRRPIVVDDLISTAGTVTAAANALLAQGCAADVTVVATHGLLVGPAVERLLGLPLRALVTTDSVPPPRELPFPHEIVGLAPLLAQSILRLHEQRPLGELIAGR